MSDSLYSSNKVNESIIFLDSALLFAKGESGKLKFTEITKSGEHYTQLASYLKIDPEKHPILILNAKKQEKFAMKFN